MGLTLFCGIFLTFNLNIGNYLKNNVSPMEQCYEYEYCYVSEVTQMWFSSIACPCVIGFGVVWHRFVTFVSPILSLLCSLLHT